MATPSDNVTIQAIIVLGSVITTWLTVKYKDKIIKVKSKDQPKDRMETIFDGYESLIKQQQLDIDRKEKQLATTQEIIERLQQELDDTREIVRRQQDEIVNSKQVNKDLIRQLDEMKKHYGVHHKTK